MGTVNLGRVRDRVTGVERINGNGSAGTIDTYRVSFESSNYYDFNVTNGRNGVGQIVSFSGDSDSRNNLIVRIVNNQDKVLALLVKSNSESEVNDGYMQASFKVEKTAVSTEGLVTTSTYSVIAYGPTGSQLFAASCVQSNLTTVEPTVSIIISSGFKDCLDAWCLLCYNDSSTGITVDDELSDNSTNPVQNKVIAKFANEVVENKADKSEVSEVANDLRTTKTRVSAVERAVGLLEEESLNLSEVLDIVDAGLAKNYFKAGDQFHVNWKENDTTTHNIDHDVVDLEDVVILENGEEVTKHTLTLQWHFSIADVPFDNAEFMAKTKATMPAGTYHFKVQHDSWGGNNGKTYQFTATSDIPAGSFLRPTNNYDQSMAGNNMNVYADWSDSTATTSYAISEGSDGVDLGTMSSKTEQGQASIYLEACEEKGGIYLNDYQAVALGDNNYYYSYVRQYLNATTTGFFTQQHIFDRPPSDWSTKRGFLAGYDDEFISAIKPTKRVISSNTLVYGGANYTMYDKVFLPTMANMNVDGFSTVQNTGGVEGNAYEYYKDLAVGQSNLNPNGTFKSYGTYAILKKYNYKNKSSAVYYWSSSALRSYASDSLIVILSGGVSFISATNRGAVSPAFNLVK